MKKANSLIIAIAIRTLFYLLSGRMGNAAFGAVAPGNRITGFEFCDPWFLIIASVAIVIHLDGSYQETFLREGIYLCAFSSFPNCFFFFFNYS